MFIDVYDVGTLLLNISFTIAVIFLERKQPVSVYAWLLLIWAFPYVGFILYLLFSQKFSSNKVYRYRKIDNKHFNAELEMQRREIADSALQASYEFGAFKDNIEYHINVSDALYTNDNDVKVFNDGTEYFDQMIEDIKSAKHSINVEFYIIRDDDIGSEVLNLLEKKAKEGVQVRIIYDEIGSAHLPIRVIRRLKNAGAQIGAFLPSRFGWISKYLQTRVNYRDHRKVVIIDGKIGYIGGFNLGDEYLGRKKKFGYWRDTGLRITGSSVYELQWRFLSDWTTTKVEEINLNEFESIRALFPLREDITPKGETGIQIVASGPDTQNQVIKQGFLKMINDAKHRIRIISPYIVLDTSVEEALKIALNSGVEVEILIPCKADHPFIYPTTLYYVGNLIESGAKVYKYSPGFVHAKVLTVDEKLAAVGSCNFDIRSFSLNFECSAFIYDPKIARELDRQFDEDLKVSEWYSPKKYKSRPRGLKLKEQVCRLLSPIL